MSWDYDAWLQDSSAYESSCFYKEDDEDDDRKKKNWELEDFEEDRRMGN